MESDRIEPAETCFFCKKRPASTKYTDRLGKRTELVCAQCLDRLEVQDALEWGILDIFELEKQERYDEVLAWFDAFEEANRHRDHDKWMARSIALHRSHTLIVADRHAEAEQVCKDWEKLGFEDVWWRWMHATTTADIVAAQGRADEAIALLESALDYYDARFIPATFMVLDTLAEISESIGRPVDPKWRPRVEDLAAYHKISLPERDSLGKTILELTDMIRKEQWARYPHADEDGAGP